MKQDNPKLKDLYRLELPAALRSRTTEELIKLDTQTELDQLPAPIADYVLSTSRFKERAFSDEPSWGWIDIPYLPGIEFYESESQRRIEKGDLMGSVVAYIASKYNSLQFSTAMQRMGNHALLNTRELNAVLKVTEQNYSPLEREIIDRLDQKHLLPDMERLGANLGELRKSRGVSGSLNLCEFLNDTPRPKLVEWRELARQNKWYARAGIISSRIKDMTGIVEDAINQVETYFWLQKREIRSIFQMEMNETLNSREFGLFSRLVDAYAQKHDFLEAGQYTSNHFGSPGWLVTEIQYDSEERRFDEGRERVDPLIFPIIFSGSTAKDNRNLPNRVKAARIYLEKMPDVAPKIQQFWKDLSEEDRKDYYVYLPRVCAELGLKLPRGKGPAKPKRW